MSNLVPVNTAVGNKMPAVPAKFANAFARNFGLAFDNMGAGLRFLSFKSFNVWLNEGGTKTELPRDDIHFIMLGMAPNAHCVWYEQGYDDESSGPPSAVWWKDTRPPVNVPPHVLTDKDDQGRNAYSTKWRCVVALGVRDANGIMNFEVDNPVLVDFGGMSVFGKSDIPNEMFRVAGYRDWCQKNGVWPASFITKLLVDTNKSVPTVMLKPMRNADSSLMLLTTELFEVVGDAMDSPAVVDALHVKLVGDFPPADVNQRQTIQQAPGQQQLPPQQQAVAQPQPQVQQPVQQMQQMATPGVQASMAMQQAGYVDVQPQQPSAQMFSDIDAILDTPMDGGGMQDIPF